MRWLMRAALGLALAVALGSSPAPARAAFACPVTIPNDSLPPPGGGGVGPDVMTHGNGLLWTILPGDGVVRVPEAGVRRDGSLDVKFVWWRRPLDQTVHTVDGVVSVETTFAGALLITGSRLEAASDPLTATTRTEGVHVGSTIRFPSGGCWEITGKAGQDSMTFAVYILPPGEPLPNTALPGPSPWAAWGVALLLAAAQQAHRRRPATEARGGNRLQC